MIVDACEEDHSSPPLLSQQHQERAEASGFDGRWGAAAIPCSLLFTLTFLQARRCATRRSERASQGEFWNVQ